MGSEDEGDNRTFRANYSSEGVIKLRDTVKEKLKEFLGDYTDDTLVEYVIVLLKNGRRKEEAKNELDVFLGDDSDPFILWLWDHLGSNLHLYVQSACIPPAEVARANVAVQEPDVSVVKNENASSKLEPGLEKEKSKELYRTHHPKELKRLEGDVNGHQTLKSSIAVISRPVEDRRRKVDDVKRFDSFQEGTQIKRFRSEDTASVKRDEVQQAAIAAPRRLLQSAVRDALTKARSSNLVRESSMKRLRSVVSTTSEDSPLEDHLEFRPVSNNVPAPTVVDAAKYVKRVRPSRNVFDRLGRTADVSDMSRKLTDVGVDFAEDTRGRPRGEIKEDYLTCDKVQYMEQKPSGMAYHGDTEMVYDPESKYDTYDDMDARRSRTVHVPKNGEFVRNNVDDPLMFQYNVANNAKRSVQKMRTDQDQFVPAPDTAHKAVNISAGMNTWRSPHYQEMRVSMKLENQKSDLGTNELNVTETKNVPTVVVNGNIKSHVEINKEPQKMMSAPGLSSTGPPIEDAESRTIFVSNVHFAATKDSLSRHFNKCGEVLKVLILTDPATGLPKGSACVEFMKIEAAENALSLDGTSFMSRILKVVKKSSASPEVASALTWSPAMRSFPFPVSGFGMTPFPRGVTNAYRGRPFKPGTRSLQWKRGGLSIPAQMSNPASTVSPRSLTYVRAGNNTNGSSTNA